MYRVISIVIFLLLFFKDAENSIAWGQLWLKPDKANQGKIYCDFERQIRIVAGDTLSDRVEPYFTIEKWGDSDNPAWFKVRQFDNDPDSAGMESDSIFILDGFQNQAIYALDDGLEWMISLQRKPYGNVLAYRFSCSNLVFSFQGELTPDEIAHDARRPDSVVGSYAVYHESRVHGEYKTGKAFHIYRPKAWDIDGDTVWCDLDIDTKNGTLSLTLPIDFWLKASYPVVIDPHFGYDIMGASEVGVGANWCYAPLVTADFYTASSGDNVNELFVGIRSPNDSGDDMAMAIYTVSKNAPKTKVMESGRFACSNVSTWYSVNVDQDLDDGVTYCVAAGEFSIGTWWFRYDSEVNGASENGATFPQTWSGAGVGYRFSMYAVYSAGSGGGDISPRRKKITESSRVNR